jgi:hypothetical protein
MYLLQQMTLAAIFSWWLAPLVSKEVKSKPDIPPLPFYEASPPSQLPSRTKAPISSGVSST